MNKTHNASWSSSSDSASCYVSLSSSGIKTGTRPIMHLGQVRLTVRHSKRATSTCTSVRIIRPVSDVYTR